MSRRSQIVDPLAAMAAANPASPVEIAAEIGEPGLERALARAVALGRTPAGPIPPEHRRRPRTVLALAAAAAVALTAILLFSGLLGGRGDGGPAFAAAAIRVAEANPRLLVTAPGWKIIRADEFEADSGELTFSDGSHGSKSTGIPPPSTEHLHDRGLESSPEHGTLLGQETTTVDYGRKEYATMLSPQGSVFIEVRGQLGSRSAYDGILHSLKPVDVDTWLSAMPPSTVRPEARALAVEQLLRGVPFRPASTPPRSRAKGRSPTGTLSRSRSETQSRAAGPRAGSRPGPSVTMPPRSERWPRSRTREWPLVEETKVPWFSNTGSSPTRCEPVISTSATPASGSNRTAGPSATAPPGS